MELKNLLFCSPGPNFGSKTSFGAKSILVIFQKSHLKFDLTIENVTEWPSHFLGNKLMYKKLNEHNFYSSWQFVTRFSEGVASGVAWIILGCLHSGLSVSQCALHTEVSVESQLGVSCLYSSLNTQTGGELCGYYFPSWMYVRANLTRNENNIVRNGPSFHQSCGVLVW